MDAIRQSEVCPKDGHRIQRPVVTEIKFEQRAYIGRVYPRGTKLRDADGINRGRKRGKLPTT